MHPGHDVINRWPSLLTWTADGFPRGSCSPLLMKIATGFPIGSCRLPPTIQWMVSQEGVTGYLGHQASMHLYSAMWNDNFKKWWPPCQCVLVQHYVKWWFLKYWLPGQHVLVQHHAKRCSWSKRQYLDNLAQNCKFPNYSTLSLKINGNTQGDVNSFLYLNIHHTVHYHL